MGAKMCRAGTVQVQVAQKHQKTVGTTMSYGDTKAQVVGDPTMIVGQEGTLTSHVYVWPFI